MTVRLPAGLLASLALLALAALPAAAGPAARAGRSAVTAQPAAISPNGDGVQDRTTLTVASPTAGTATVEVDAADGSPVALLSPALPLAAGVPAQLPWEGQSDVAGTAPVVPDGTYTAFVDVTDARGVHSTASATVVVDTVAPQLDFVRSTAAFGRAGASAVAAFQVAADEPASLSLQVRGSRGAVLASTAGASLAWNGLRPDGTPAADGSYTVAARAVDGAGNSSGLSRTVLLDTQAPRLAWVAAPTVAGRGAPLAGRLAVDDLDRALSVRETVVDQEGDVLASSPPVPAGPGPLALAWTPGPGGRPLLPGAYRVAVTVTDSAGNTATSGPQPFLVDYAVQAHAVFSGDAGGAARRIALTFDDCYVGRAWAAILDVLERERLQAAFFCPGKAVLANPGLGVRTVADGNVVGSHGWDHADFARLSYASALERLRLDRQVWWQVAHAAPTPFFRPPYGSTTASTVAAAGAAGYGLVVRWNVDPRDWTRPGVQAIVDRVLGATRPGAIVLLHTLPETAAALPAIVRGLRARGLQPVRLDRLLDVGPPPAPAG